MKLIIILSDKKEIITTLDRHEFNVAKFELQKDTLFPFDHCGVLNEHYVKHQQTEQIH